MPTEKLRDKYAAARRVNLGSGAISHLRAGQAVVANVPLRLDTARPYHTFTLLIVYGKLRQNLGLRMNVIQHTGASQLFDTPGIGRIAKKHPIGA